ncbi:MAG: transcriptional repressor [Candidatus Saccharicenans sp.]|jgi:Fur family peroxide stress response transcriptional regulator|nr:transcriptional repressor [Candidatus Saccharicenans sp.]MDH7492409.1 Fur family transcriptional regulator [Candidatus Saccharicenans sp.]
MEKQDKKPKRWSLEDIRDYLSQHDIRSSVYRLKIFEYLINDRTHPTAEEIYKHLKKELPAISPGTVYNTLRLFLEKKIVQLVNVEKNQFRFDATLSWHGHLKCLGCGRVFDLHIENLKLSGLEGFEIFEKHLDLKGLCPECLKRKNI